MKKILLIIIIVFLGCRHPENKNRKNTTVERKNLKQQKSFINCVNAISSFEDVKLNLSKLTLKNDEGFYVDEKKINNYNCLKSYLNNNKTNDKTDNNHYLYFLKEKQKKHFPLFKKIKNGYVLIGSLVEYYGENDIPGVLFQFTLFDKVGSQIDYLIAYNRFSWELYLERNFMFNSNQFEIEVTDIEEDWVLLNEQGDIVGDRKKPIITKNKFTYSISKDGFLEK